MSIEKLNSAAWAAGFAMAPTEDDAVEAVGSIEPKTSDAAPSAWRSAKFPALAAPATAHPRQWLTVWQRKAAI